MRTESYYLNEETRDLIVLTEDDNGFHAAVARKVSPEEFWSLTNGRMSPTVTMNDPVARPFSRSVKQHTPENRAKCQNRLTQEQRDKMISLIKKGESIDEIAGKVGTSRTTVWIYKKKLDSSGLVTGKHREDQGSGLTFINQRRLTPAQCEEVKQLSDEGFSTSEIVEETGFDQKMVVDYIRRTKFIGTGYMKPKDRIHLKDEVRSYLAMGNSIDEISDLTGESIPALEEVIGEIEKDGNE